MWNFQDGVGVDRKISQRNSLGFVTRTTTQLLVWNTFFAGLVLLFLITSMTLAFGRVPTVVVSADVGKYELGRNGSYLLDPIGKYTIHEISSSQLSGSFTRIGDSSINLGSYSKPVWLHFSLAGGKERSATAGKVVKGEDSVWFLYLGKNLDFYDEIRVYWKQTTGPAINDDSRWNQATYGMFNAVRRGTRDPLCIKISVPEGTGKPLEVYLRVITQSGCFVQPTLFTPERWGAFAQRLSLFYGAYYGLALSMIIYSLFHFFFLRDRVRLIFIFYAITLCAYFFVANELSLPLLPTSLLVATRKTAQFLLLLTIIQMLWFTSVFLDARRIMPWMNRLLYLVMVGAGGFMMAMLFFTYMELGVYLPDFGMFHVLVVLTAGIYALIKGYKPARFFVSAWFFFLGGGFIYALNFKGVFPWPFLGNNAAQAGSGIEMVLLSLAIADRVKFIFEKLQRSQKKRQRQLAALTEQLVQAEESERRRIAGVLHDSIGQTLVAIKWEVKRLIRSCGSAVAEESMAAKYLDTCIEETRSLTAELYPQALYQHGLIFALESLAEDLNSRFGLNVRIEAEDEPIMATEELSFIIYRVVSELLTNVIKHAKAENAEVRMVVQNGMVTISVADDGIGFEYIPDQNENGSGFGLFSIRERLVRIGGGIRQVASGNKGAKMEMKIPVSG